jgi:Putative bacterial sensory transduction regulator
MPWWSWRPGSPGAREPEAGEVALHSVRVGVPAQRHPGHSGVSTDLSTIDEPGQIAPVTLARIGKALDLLDIRYLADGGGSLLAMWERHAVLFTLEGPDDEILVMRARPHATVPPDWADRAYRVVNEWNHTRRFCKAYVGDPTERGQLPIYAELQVPLNSGAHDALLVEMIDCGAAVATSFVDWLHDEGALL